MVYIKFTVHIVFTLYMFFHVYSIADYWVKEKLSYMDRPVVEQVMLSANKDAFKKDNPAPFRRAINRAFIKQFRRTRARSRAPQKTVSVTVP